MKTFVAFLAFIVAAAAQTHPSSTNHPGSEPYTPTKQEWLLLCLFQDKTTYDLANTGEVQFVFSADDDPETIDVLVVYAKSASKEDVDGAFAEAQREVRTLAIHHGWNWVKIRNSAMKMPEIKAPH